MRHVLACLILVAVTLLGTEVWAQGIDLGVTAREPTPTGPTEILRMALAMIVAVGLAATIAFHPMVRRKAQTLEELHHPATLLVYALVAVVISEVVVARPEMAFVVFALGGLLRFRSVVGEGGNETGRVILVSIVGLACGMEAYAVAGLATLGAWILLAVMERRRLLQLAIHSTDPTTLPAAAVAIQAALVDTGARILSTRFQPRKGHALVILSPPADKDRAALDALLARIATEQKLTLDWEEG